MLSKIYFKIKTNFKQNNIKMSKQQVEQPEWFQPEGNGIDKGLFT